MKTSSRWLGPRFGVAWLAVWWSFLLVFAPHPAWSAALTNALVNDPALDLTSRDTQLETTLVLGAHNLLISAYVDSGSWDDVPGVFDHFIGLSSSTDGGTTWNDLGPLPGTPQGDGLNPVLARAFGVGSMGDTIFLATTDFMTNNIMVYTHLNNGFGFLPSLMGAVVAAAGAPGIRVEKPWITVDNFSDPMFPPMMKGQGNVYLTWRSNMNSIWISRSIDGGNSFQPAIPLTLLATPPANVHAPVVVVGSNAVAGASHPVYVFWLEQAMANGANAIRMRRSVDQGMTFEAVQTVVTLNNNGPNGDLRLQGGFRWNSFPQAVANPIVPNNLYVAYNDKPPGAGNADKADVFLLQSSMGGLTGSWMPAAPGTRVNDEPALAPPAPPGTNDNFGPALAITPDGRNLFVGFYDRRRDLNNNLIDTFGRIATVNAMGAATFPAASFRITTESFPPVTDQDPGFRLDPALQDYYMGGYDTAVADNRFFYYTWGDNRRAHAFAGGRHANQPDVQFARIPVAGPGAILDLYTEAANGGIAISGGNGNGAIDFNECNNLVITLINRGTLGAVDVQGTLESRTPGVTVSQAPSVFPDVAPGMTGASTMPFSITIPADFECGTIIRLRLTVTTANAGTFVIPIQLNTGTDTPALTVDSLNVFPIPIPDGAGSVDSTVNVGGLTAPLSSVRVRLWITHPRQADLDLWLEGPDGTTVVLSSDNGTMTDYGTSCAMPTLFTDAAATEITLAPAGNFTGPFRPEQRLAAFSGKSGNGLWTLHVRDDLAGPGVQGMIQCWGLDLGTASCTDGGGMCLAFAGAHIRGGNGNGRLDPNECVDLSVILTNIRPTAFLGVSAILESRTPAVAVLQARSDYPDIPGTGAPAPARPFGTNKTPFKVSIPAGFPCGAFAEFVLKVSALDEGTFDVPFRLQVGSCTTMPAFTDVTPALPRPIPDTGNIAANTGVDSFIPVSGLIAPIGKVTVSVGIFHGNVSDLVLTLFAPDGTSVVLATNVDSGGDNFGLFTTIVPPFTCDVPTTFDDDAGLNIKDSFPPYAGAFVPTGPVVLPSVPPSSSFPVRPLFAAFSGKAAALANGMWRLNVRDLNAGDAGELVCWSLTICEPTQFRPITGILPANIRNEANSFNDIRIPVTGITAPISKVRVSMFVTHPASQDLDISLISPDGTTVNLTSDNPATGTAANYGASMSMSTVFDDDAETSITAATAANPFAVGTFRPEEPLGRFAGKSGTAVNDNWILRVVDDNPGAPMVQRVNTLLLEIFTASCSDGGGACLPNRVLTVGSVNPASGVEITVSAKDIDMLQNGTTSFTRTYGDGLLVNLTAPATAPNGNTFLHWVLDGVVQTPRQPTLAVTMNAEHAATAVYVGPSTLTVTSLNPSAGVDVVVSRPDRNGLTDGVTPFTRAYVNGVSVQLTAEATAPNGHVFLRWKIDGRAQLPGVNPITVEMNTDHRVVAEYDSPTRTLRVLSDEPDSGVPIMATIDFNLAADGVTPFTREYLTGKMVKLTAPEILPSGRLFKRWEVDGEDFANGQFEIDIFMNVNHTAVARYQSATVVFRVESDDPDSDVGIVATPDVHGNGFGFTTMMREYKRGDPVTLIAPPLVNGQVFKRWEVDGDDYPRGRRTITVDADDDLILLANYDDPDDDDDDDKGSRALWFNGFFDHIQVEDSASLRITGPITIEAWINRDVMGVAHCIVEKHGCPGDAPAVGGYALRVLDTDQLAFETKDDCGTGTALSGATTILAGRWYHVAGVWDGGDLSVYVDGVLDGSVASADNPKLGNTPLIIGARGDDPFQSQFSGYIDEVRLWSTARSPGDIASSRAGCLTGLEPDLAGYWRFNEESGIVAYDSSPNVNNGLLVNTPLWVASTVGCALPSPAPVVRPMPAPAQPVPLALTISTNMAGHSCRLTVTGRKGAVTFVEVSNDLIRWAPLVCCTNTTGIYQLTDPMHACADKRFFRVRQEP